VDGWTASLNESNQGPLYMVFVDVMLYYGRPGRQNVHDLKICDFAATTDSDGEVYIYLTKDEQTKNHQDVIISKNILSCIIYREWMVYPISVLFFCNKKYPTNIIKYRLSEKVSNNLCVFDFDFIYIFR
jgi:hypothetical protein